MIQDYVITIDTTVKMASKQKEDPRIKNLRIKTGVLKRYAAVALTHRLC